MSDPNTTQPAPDAGATQAVQDAAAAQPKEKKGGKSAIAKAEGPRDYITTRLVQHDDEDYPEGDTIRLTEKQAGPLLACGAILDAAEVEAAEKAAADAKAEKLAESAARRKGGK
ncbi:hypothetical protein [Oceanibaculum indicum]|uniref:Uncharacterized protein n=1 Tax=Oceanibaculum indicum P24 TaxID=1207063 RepID=K2K036_9PROT|nr:hypothetical protein [Oceanibaculum indicum]EKE70890.1 hypothetical protein P24_15144 [Oceanibaculum indicum P24]